MQTDRKTLAGHVVHGGCVLLAGWFTLFLIEAAPTEWFTIFNKLGPTLKPWMIGAAAVFSIIPTLGFAALAVKALKLPLPRD